jgi:hypothetical protein
MKTFFRIFILSFFFVSCSSDLDLEQVYDLKLNPVFTGNLMTFDVKASEFLNAGGDQTTEVEKINFEFFNNPDLNKFILRTDLFFEINNTINRDYTIDIHLLDKDNVKLHVIPFVVPAYTPGQLPVSQNEIFENTNFDILKKTKFLEFHITMLAGIPITASSSGSLKLSSSATLYFELK